MKSLLFTFFLTTLCRLSLTAGQAVVGYPAGAPPSIRDAMPSAPVPVISIPIAPSPQSLSGTPGMLSSALFPVQPESFVSDILPVAPASPYFETAYSEITAMLDGRDSVNLKRAVFLLEWAYLDGQPDYSDYCARIDTTAAAVRRFIAANRLDRSPIGRNIALFQFFSYPYSMNDYKPFSYDLDDIFGEKDYTKIFVTKLMRTHTGQCRSLPLYYKILANEIGAEAYIAYAPNHSFIRHRDEADSCWINVELTNNSLAREIYLIETMGITQEAIDKGTYLKPCSDREVVLTLLADLAESYLRCEDRIGVFVRKCLGRVLGENPGELHALIVVNNCLCSILWQHKDLLVAKGLPDDEFIKTILSRLEDVKAKIVATGYIDMPENLYNDWIEAMEAEIERRKTVSNTH